MENCPNVKILCSSKRYLASKKANRALFKKNLIEGILPNQEYESKGDLSSLPELNSPIVPLFDAMPLELSKVPISPRPLSVVKNSGCSKSEIETTEHLSTIFSENHLNEKRDDAVYMKRYDEERGSIENDEDDLKQMKLFRKGK